MKRKKIFLIPYNSMFSVMSLLLAFFGNFSIFPFFPYLKADLSDAPIYLSAMLFGTPSGMTVLFVVLIIRAMLFSSSGLIGFLMRLSSAILILFIGISRKKTPIIKKVLLLILGVILSLAVKLLMSYFCWINFFSIPKSTIDPIFLSVITPYNAMKIILSLLSAIVIKKYIDRKCLNKND